VARGPRLIWNGPGGSHATAEQLVHQSVSLPNSDDGQLMRHVADGRSIAADFLMVPASAGLLCLKAKLRDLDLFRCLASTAGNRHTPWPALCVVVLVG
jgi:hypothetical protein